jgi:hypothetical protein
VDGIVSVRLTPSFQISKWTRHGSGCGIGIALAQKAVLRVLEALPPKRSGSLGRGLRSVVRAFTEAIPPSVKLLQSRGKYVNLLPHIFEDAAYVG